MLKLLLQFAVLLFVIWPALTLWHELGHGLLPLVAGRAPVAIRLGAGKATFTVRIEIGRAHV